MKWNFIIRISHNTRFALFLLENLSDLPPCTSLSWDQLCVWCMWTLGKRQGTEVLVTAWVTLRWLFVPVELVCRLCHELLFLLIPTLWQVAACCRWQQGPSAGLPLPQPHWNDWSPESSLWLGQKRAVAGSDPVPLSPQPPPAPRVHLRILWTY